MSTRREKKWIASFFLVGLAIALAVGIAWGQGAGGWVSVQGTLAQYAPAAGDRVNTFFLDDGSEVHFPAQFYSRIGSIVKKGDQVKVTGWMYVGPVGDVHIYASTIANPTNGSTVTISTNTASTAAGPYPMASAATYPPSATYQPAAEQPTMTGAAPLTAPSSGASVPTAVPNTGYQPGLPMGYTPASPALPGPPAPPPGPLGAAAPAPPLGAPPAPPAPGMSGVGAPTTTAYAQESKSTLSGVVRGFVYGPAGEIGGFLLLTDDGTTVTVQVSPEISPWITSVATMGSSVKVTGWMNIGPAGERTFVAMSVQNVKTGKTVSSVSTQTTGGYSR